MIKRVVLYSRKIINPGGAERLLFEEYKYLKTHNIAVKVFTFELDNNALFNNKVEDIEVIHTGGVIKNYILNLRRSLKRFKPDIVIASQSCPILYCALLLTGIPYVMHIHSSIFWFPDNLIKFSLIFRRAMKRVKSLSPGHKEFICPPPRFSLFEKLKIMIAGLIYYLSVKKAKEIFVLTEKMKKEIKLIYGIDSTVITGGLSREYLNGERIPDAKERLGLSGKKIILNVNRLDPVKRIDLLIKVFKVLSKEDRELFLLIVGVGPEEEKLKELVHTEKLTDRVRFDGFVDDKKLKVYYSACDVYVATSWADFSLSAYEALAFGNKVVWSSEMDENLIKNEQVFVAEPTLHSFVEVTRKALNTTVNPNIDLRDYLWDNYCRKIYERLCAII